ncbi:MAG: porin family protein [Saprospiraceae bacterium]|nr:porin family protein [Saprospiraceae bacterium]
MKKPLLLFTLLLLTANFLTAQNEFRVGVRGGLNLNNVTLTGPDAEYFNSIKQSDNGFHVGLAAEIPIAGPFAIRTGIDAVSKGFKLEETELGITYTGTSRPVYLQVPVVLAYNGRLFYFGAGPYFGLGVTGQYKTSYKNTPSNPLPVDLGEEGDLKFGSTVNDDYSASDFGFVAEAGIKISIFRIGLSYAAGLKDVLPENSIEDYKALHAVLGVTVGLMFGL